MLISSLFYPHFFEFDGLTWRDWTPQVQSVWVNLPFPSTWQMAWFSPTALTELHRSAYMHLFKFFNHTIWVSRFFFFKNYTVINLSKIMCIMSIHANMYIGTYHIFPINVNFSLKKITYLIVWIKCNIILVVKLTTDFLPNLPKMWFFFSRVHCQALCKKLTVHGIILWVLPGKPNGA